MNNNDTAATKQRGALARGGMLSFAGSATSALLGFVLTILIARLLGAEGSGVVFQATGVFAVVMAFAKVGMDSTAIYLLPRVRLDNVGQLRSTVVVLCTAALVASLVLVTGVSFLAPVLWRGVDNQVAATVQALLVFIPVGALLLITTAILRALGSVKEYVVVANIAVPVLRPPLVAVAAVATGSALVVAVAWALPLAMLLVVAVLLVVRHLREQEPGQGSWQWPSRQQWRRVLSFAAPRTVSAGLEQALIWVDVLLVGWLVTDQAAGIYGGAARFIQAGLVVDAALRVVVSPQFSSLLHQDKKEQVRELYMTATMWLVLVASPIYVVLAVFSPVFLQILGPEFAAGQTALTILAVAMAVTFLAGNIHSLLIMSGRSGWAAVNKAIVLGINIVGNLLAVPRFGIAGAAMVWAASMILDAVLAAVQVRLFVGVKAKITQALLPLVVVAVAVGLPAVGARWLLGPTWWAMAAALVVGVVVYVVACRRWRVRLHLEGLVSMVCSRT